MGKAYKIGVFDSGIGGLTVAKAIKQELFNVPICYFGDTAHLPYGDKSAELIFRYSKQIIAFLAKENCTHIVVACNSASSVLAKYNFHKYEGIPIINVVDPVVQYLAKNDFIKSLGIIGTRATINSQIYLNKIESASLEIDVHAMATPLLAPMIEEGFVTNNISDLVIKNYLSYPDFLEVDALLLACTHYPLIKKQVEQVLPKAQILDNSSLTAEFIAIEFPELKQQTEAIPDSFFVSDLTESFKASTKHFFGESISLMEQKL